MIDPVNPTLKSRASTWARSSVERATARARTKLPGLSVASEHRGVDRTAVLRLIILLAILLLVYWAMGASTNEGDFGIVNFLGPAVFCLFSLWTGVKIAIADNLTIWTPIPMFMMATAIYFGFSPLLFFLGKEETVAFVNSYWPVTPHDLWRTNILNTVSLLTIYSTYLQVDRLLEVRGRDVKKAPDPVMGGVDPAKAAALVFLGIGLPIRYLLVLPYVFGQLSFTLPGSIFSLNCITKIALFMLAYLWAKRGGPWRFSFWILFVTETLSSLMCFSKLEILLGFVMAALGRFLANKNYKEATLTGLATIACYVVILSPVVTWGREEIKAVTGDINKAPASLRLSLAIRGVRLWASREMEDAKVHAHQDWWSRLNYTSAQTAAMQMYDSDNPGSSFQLAFYTWIPRFLWEDKPTFVLGEDFNELVLGNRDTCTGPGTFGDAYWNGGWLMVLLISFYIGVLFAWLSRTVLGIIARSEWLLLPCAFLGILMAIRVDDWFIGVYFSNFIMYLLYYFFIRLIMVKGRKGT